MVCRKLKLKKITDAKAAGGCGVVQFSSRLALFRGGVAARAASGWLDRFESNGGGFAMVRRVVAATGWHMTGKEKPARGGPVLAWGNTIRSRIYTLWSARWPWCRFP